MGLVGIVSLFGFGIVRPFRAKSRDLSKRFEAIAADSLARTLSMHTAHEAHEANGSGAPPQPGHSRRLPCSSMRIMMRLKLAEFSARAISLLSRLQYYVIEEAIWDPFHHDLDADARHYSRCMRRSASATLLGEKTDRRISNCLWGFPT